MLNRLLLTLGATACLLLSGCGGSKTQSESEKPKEQAGSAIPLPPAGFTVTDPGTISGKVSFTGTRPVMKTIDMSANPACEKAHPSPVKSEEVVVNDNGTLKNVFVWIKSGLPDAPWTPPSAAVTLDQKGCIYTPRVLGVMVNQEVHFTNSDPTNHNIHPMPNLNQEWNESQPPNGEAKAKKFDKEEVMVPVKCNIHPWMRAYIGVVHHPFFAVTGTDGTFRINGVPPGKYTLEAWQERYGKQPMELTVAPKQDQTANFEFKAQ